MRNKNIPGLTGAILVDEFRPRQGFRVSDNFQGSWTYVPVDLRDVLPVDLLSFPEVTTSKEVGLKSLPLSLRSRFPNHQMQDDDENVIVRRF